MKNIAVTPNGTPIAIPNTAVEGLELVVEAVAADAEVAAGTSGGEVDVVSVFARAVVVAADCTDELDVVDKDSKIDPAVQCTKAVVVSLLLLSQGVDWLVSPHHQFNSAVGGFGHIHKFDHVFPWTYEDLTSVVRKEWSGILLMNLLSLHHCVGHAVVVLQSLTVQAPRYVYTLLSDS